MDINSLSDEELARAADLYFLKAFTVVRKAYGNEYVHLMLTGSSINTAIKVQHHVTIGHDDKHKITSNNLIAAVEEAVRRDIESRVKPPVTMTLALEAPKPVIEDGEFTEVLL